MPSHVAITQNTSITVADTQMVGAILLAVNGNV
jgi:hypothetical protein